jgi:hypothetical protein
MLSRRAGSGALAGLGTRSVIGNRRRTRPQVGVLHAFFATGTGMPATFTFTAPR